MKVIVSCGGKFHAFHLANQLDKQGYLYKLITTYYSPKRGILPEFRKDSEEIALDKVITNILPEIIGRGCEKIPLIGKKIKWNYYAAEIYDLWAKNYLEPCDLLVTWSNFSLHQIRVAKKLGIKTVLERSSSHISYQKKILEEEYSKYNIKAQPVDKYILRKELAEYSESDYISIPSEFVRRTFIENGVNTDKLIKVVQGVDLTNFRRLPKKDNIFRVLFVGGLVLRKGIHYLLEGFSKLKLKNAELLIIGGISEEIKPFLERYKGSFKHINKVPQSELSWYFSQGSVFILPSIEDGFGAVIIQAMACGLPVICTNNTGGPDIVRENIDGFIIPIRNVEAIMEKLLYLYNKQDICNEMGKSAEHKVRSGHSWNDFGNEIIKEYERILKK